MKKKILCTLVLTLLICTTFIAMGNVADEIYQKEKNDKETDKIDYKTSQNGVILDQVLDENGNGYSIISVWGSYYEMGYAQAELLGDYIGQAVIENKAFAGDDNYNEIRGIMSEAVWMPQEIEDEFDGMVDCLAISHPSQNIDKLDLKVLNTLGDWSYGYGFACRSHTCWGRYVSDPIKTLSTRRLDFAEPYTSSNHHVLCARDPDDGSAKWINLAIPGYVLGITCVNEYGTLLSIHDYNSYNTDFSSNTIPRTVACRYAATYSSGTDITHYLEDCYNELQNYEIMSGSFLNYYAPEGYGGVITANPLQSGPDFYDLRTPQETWYHGEAMITTNQWTDGTYTPFDEDFGVDFYYADETPKTLESHWDLLHYEGSGSRGGHQLSLAYRDKEDMTIWFDGRISKSGDKTPRLELEWENLFFEPPLTPNIYGATSGKTGENQIYKLKAIDPDGDNISYCIDWGDNSSEVCIGPFPSGVEQTTSHTWDEEGTYIIKTKAIDIHGAESDWATLTVSMPKTKIYNPIIQLLFKVLERLPIFEKILKQIII